MWELDERIDTTGPSLFLECFPPIKMFCCSAQIHISGSDKHGKDIKELAASKADCCLSSRFLCVGQKAALERTAGDQQACTFCASVKGNASLLKHKLSSWLSSILWHLIFLIENTNMGEVIDISATGSEGFLFDPLPQQPEGLAQSAKTPPIRAAPHQLEPLMLADDPDRPAIRRLHVAR